MRSKRSAFRYTCTDQMIGVKTSYEDGEACLINISTDGCAFEETTVKLSLAEKVLISLQLGDEGSLFEAAGMVIRQLEGCCAVQFSLIEPEAKVDLRNYFSKQLRKK